MEYNTQREQLKISDYGRHVAKMVEYCKTIPDRSERTAMANTIVEVMAHVNPKIKERTDYKHILWDHMMMMAGYELDVDCPYEIRREEVENMHPGLLKDLKPVNLHIIEQGIRMEVISALIIAIFAAAALAVCFGLSLVTTGRKNRNTLIELKDFDLIPTEIAAGISMEAAAAKKEANEAKRKKKKKKK